MSEEEDQAIAKLVARLRRIVSEGIDTSTDAGMDYVRETIAVYDERLRRVNAPEPQIKKRPN